MKTHSFSCEADARVPFHSGPCLTVFEIEVITKFVSVELPSFPLQKFHDVQFLKHMYKNVFKDKAYRQELTRSKRAQTVRSVLVSAIVRHLILQEGHALPSLDEIKEMSFASIGRLFPKQPTEWRYLQHFSRAVRVLHKVVGVPSLHNKHLFLHVGRMLDGSTEMCATGGSPSKATSRRLMIVEEITRDLSDHNPSGVDDEADCIAEREEVQAEQETDHHLPCDDNTSLDSQEIETDPLGDLITAWSEEESSTSSQGCYLIDTDNGIVSTTSQLHFNGLLDNATTLNYGTECDDYDDCSDDSSVSVIQSLLND